MSWASERLQYLSNRYTYQEIRDYTGLPQSTLGYVLRGERLLPARYILNVRSMYSKSVYRQLREAGASTSIARSYRWRSVQHAIEYLTESTSVIEQLAKYRLAQYNQYLARKGKYVSDDITMQLLRDSIRRAMGKSPMDLGRQEGSDSPSLRHLVIVDTDE